MFQSIARKSFLETRNFGAHAVTSLQCGGQELVLSNQISVGKNEVRLRKTVSNVPTCGASSPCGLPARIEPCTSATTRYSTRLACKSVVNVSWRDRSWSPSLLVLTPLARLLEVTNRFSGIPESTRTVPSSQKMRALEFGSTWSRR